jgi:hypothetical protein
MKRVPWTLIAMLFFFLLCCCSSSSPPQTEVAEAESDPQPGETPAEAPPADTPSETEEKPEEIAEKPEEKPEDQPAKFEVSEEVYKQTFDDIKSIIEKLNRIIHNREYKNWLNYLTDNYVKQTSRPEYLRRWQKDPRLQQKNIVLRTLKDYFDYVVVPTRSEAKLDEIEFRDDTHVYAYTVFQAKKYLLYNLVKTEKGWKIDFY